MQMADEAPDGSGADSSRRGSGGFGCRRLMRFWTVPVQIADKVPAGSGANG